jgi:hypothetical protein
MIGEEPTRAVLRIPVGRRFAHVGARRVLFPPLAFDATPALVAAWTNVAYLLAGPLAQVLPGNRRHDTAAGTAATLTAVFCRRPISWGEMQRLALARGVIRVDM